MFQYTLDIFDIFICTQDKCIVNYMRKGVHFTNGEPLLCCSLNDKGLVTFNLFSPAFAFVGDYEVAGKLLTLDISGKGQVVMNYSEC